MKRVLLLVLTLALILTFIPGNILFVYATSNDLNISPNTEEKTVVIQFNSNGGTSVSQIETLPNQVITLPSEVPDKAGYNFVGWSTSKNGDVEYGTNDAFCTDESTTLYAQWDKLCDPYVYEDCYYCSGAGEVYSHSIDCSNCGGSGLSSRSCSTCDGSGKYTCYWCDGTGIEECYYCDGTGKDPYKQSTCSTCGGSGNVCSVGICSTCSSIMGMTVRDYDGSCQRAGHNVWSTCTGCSKCGGDGKISLQPCSRCEGACTETCSSCYGKGKRTCYSCNGTGKKDCSTCDGTGKKKVYKTCDNCVGNGKIQVTCSICDGTGTVIRKSVSTPSAPVVHSYDETVVILQEISNGEYSIDGVNWQESPTFEGLTGGKEYTFYQRYAKTDTTLRSAISAGLTVIAQHIYDNDCDTTCNGCGYVRTVPSHVYDNACDTDCNVCSAIREAPHVYDTVCDTTCNECGVTRTALHLYDDESDAACNLCLHNRAKSYGTTGSCYWYVIDTTLYVTGNGAMADYSSRGPWGSSITKVVIQEGVTIIGKYAFCYCTKLTSIIIPDSVIIVRSYAFYYNESLSTIIIGDGLTNIAASAFYACSNIKNVWYKGSSRSNISISSYNTPLTSANWHYDVDVVGEHVYYNVCDISCNICGDVRTVPHAYDNVCDATCNVCGGTRTVPDHAYDNACDSTCNVCGIVRTVPDHVYDDEKDRECNECGFVAYIIGDIDGDQAVTQDDAVYLLLHTMFGEAFYPLNNAPADIDNNGTVNQDDAVYLLLHTMFGEIFYPLNPPALPVKTKK